MKPTHFVRSYLNVFHDKPDDAGGGGGGGVVMPSLMDQIAGIVAPGMRLATTDLGAASGGDGETGSGGDGETGGAGEGGAGAGAGAAGEGEGGAGAGGEGAAGGEDWIAALTPEVRKMVLADREKLARMEGELSVLKKPEGDGKPAAAKPAAVVNPLSAVATVEDLEAQEQRAEFWRDWAFQNRDGGTVKDGDGNDVEITAEQAAAMFVHNDKVLRKHVPARRAELAAAAEISQGRTAAFEAATVEYPWLGNQESDEFKLFQRLAGALPDVLNRFSDSPWLLADMVAGHMARQAKGKPAAGGAAPAVPSPAPVKPVARPTVVPGGGNAGGSRGGSSNRAMSLEDLAKQGGSRDATVRWIEENFGVAGAA